jgi:uncharacterized phage protein (TIGR01671 family)
MREILFRGKREDNGEWVYGGLITYNLLKKQRCLIMSFDVKLVNLKIEAEQMSEFVIPETVGQYTGLTDKNGTKIFEGDIVQYFNGTPAHIMFLQGGFIIVGEGFRNEFIGHAVAHIEVIGNIHERGNDGRI